MDPSGTSFQYDAKAIGSGSEGAQQSLQESYNKVVIYFRPRCTESMINASYLLLFLLYVFSCSVDDFVRSHHVNLDNS